ncbi:unnamed protein product [Sphagnum troendelagicum]|uniref:Uncharacterized protein n=1 Tax=Sphagnum troendelagicum TaxID=128251 RepID=A0ABP0TJK1_9BRYO
MQPSVGYSSFPEEGSLPTTQLGAGYRSFPSTAASLPPSQVRDAVVFRAGPPNYHPSNCGIQWFSKHARLTTTTARCRIRRPTGQGSFATTQRGRG